MLRNYTQGCFINFLRNYISAVLHIPLYRYRVEELQFAFLGCSWFSLASFFSLGFSLSSGTDCSRDASWTVVALASDVFFLRCRCTVHHHHITSGQVLGRDWPSYLRGSHALTWSGNKPVSSSSRSSLQAP